MQRPVNEARTWNAHDAGAGRSGAEQGGSDARPTDHGYARSIVHDVHPLCRHRLWRYARPQNVDPLSVHDSVVCPRTGSRLQGFKCVLDDYLQRDITEH